jgi:sulfur-oxidizing protein SoxY
MASRWVARTFAPAAAAALVLSVAGAALAAGGPPAEEESSWPFLVEEVFANRPIHDGAGLIALEAPTNHPDAGAIPVVIRTTAPAEGASRIEKLTLLVDENPSPVVATFDVGEETVLSKIETTIRVNRFSSVHLVAETADGTLYAVERYVKGSGGCSARGVELPEVALKDLGEMTFAQLDRREISDDLVERQVEVSVQHPNYTGMQQNYITLHYILAHFMTEMALKQGSDELVKISTGISVSENPHFRITYVTGLDGRELGADVTDSEGYKFHRQWPLDASGT